VTKPTELPTERLLLRPFRLSDIDDVLRYASDPEWAAFYLRAYDRGVTEHMVARSVVISWDKEAVFAIEADGRVVGLVSLEVAQESRTAELGYDLARDVWGQGLATEAASAVVDWGFREYGLARIFAEADARNGRSLRVMERLGMTREGVHRRDQIERGEREIARYATLRSDWSSPGGILPSVTLPSGEYETTDRNQPPELTTPRLVLRRFQAGDVEDVHRYADDAEWNRFLGLPEPYSRRDAEEFVAKAMLCDPKAVSMWAIVHEGRCAGSIYLRGESPGSATLGYSLARPLWGRGLMTEAARAVVVHGFEDRKLARIYSFAIVGNDPSARVLEKVGMRREGILRSNRVVHGDRVDEVLYSILREDWEA